MLKIPGVGKALSSFYYFTCINTNNQLEICIVYKITNSHNVTIHKMKNYLVNTDRRWPNIQTIKTKIDGYFSSASGTKIVTIRYDSNRYYLWFDLDQFSGFPVL